MTKNEVIMILRQIETVYPDFLAKSETVTCWFTFANLMDYTEVEARLRDHIRKSPFPPRMSDVFLTRDIDLEAMLMEDGNELLRMKGNRNTTSDWMYEYSLRDSFLDS